MERTRVIFHEWRFLNNEMRDEVVAKREAYSQYFTRVLDDGIRSGVFRNDVNARIAVFTILGAVNWLCEWLSPDGPEDPAQIGREVARIVLTGLKRRWD